MTVALLLCLMASLALPALADTPWGTSIMYVKTANGKPVNVRSAPYKGDNVIGSAPYGHEVLVDWSYAGNDGWTKVVWGSMGDGYIMSQFLVNEKPGPAPSPSQKDKEKEAATTDQAKLEQELKSEKPVSEYFYIAVRPTRVSGWINFRTGPSATTTRISSFPQDKELLVLGETNNWYRARDPETDKVGYIHKSYTIKGITVEIGGNVGPLQKALESVNKDIKNTQSQLRDVEKLLKLDPSNTELLSQKQKLLAQAISDTKEKLETLKTASEQANEQMKQGTITQQEYDALQREIEETEQALKKLESQASGTNATLAKIDEIGGKFQKAGTAMTDAGKKLTAGVTAPNGQELKRLQRDKEVPQDRPGGGGYVIRDSFRQSCWSSGPLVPVPGGIARILSSVASSSFLPPGGVPGLRWRWRCWRWGRRNCSSWIIPPSSG